MSASLVGSEMCIRDSSSAGRDPARPSALGGPRRARRACTRCWATRHHEVLASSGAGLPPA
eukprot:9844713-Alexandrium_andersonii.AAC.1